jgi:hypothetical protein
MVLNTSCLQKYQIIILSGLFFSACYIFKVHFIICSYNIKRNQSHASSLGGLGARGFGRDKVVGAVGCSWRRFLVAGVAASHTEHKGDKSPAVRGPNSAKGDGGDKTVGCTGSKSKTM